LIVVQEDIQTVFTGGSGQVYSEAVKNIEEEHAALAAAAKKAAEPAKTYTIPYHIIPYRTVPYHTIPYHVHSI
jgi:hypothetical protein